MNIVLRALLDGEQEVFINCGNYNLDWFVKSDPESQVCVITVSDNGDENQVLVSKSRLSDIRPMEED